MIRKTQLLVFAAIAIGAGLLAVAILFSVPQTAEAGLPAGNHYQVLSPITHGNLTIFPVVASATHDTREFLTLDEGLRSGEVEVTEHGGIRPMVRRPHSYYPQQHSDGAQVNQLYLINNSKRPLLLLAGEIVTGGKQDRIVGKDRIVPAETEADLSVFCVEPGRWTETTASFGAVGGLMVAPSVRNKAMAKKDQNEVWNEVNRANTSNYDMLAAAAPQAREELRGNSSYARTMNNAQVQKEVDKIAVPMEHSYESEIHQLRDRNAVGVVVAVNGKIIWADLFASTSLLEKYWPKLVRSYASEAMNTSGNGEGVSVKRAQDYLDELEGRREISESEPGVYRHTEIIGDGYRAFELTSLLPSTGFEVHISKMTE
jgi:hypothetical protein